MVVIVLRNVKAAGGVDLRSGIINQPCGSDAALSNGPSVQKRLEHSARLAQRQHTIDIDIDRVADRTTALATGMLLSSVVTQASTLSRPSLKRTPRLVTSADVRTNIVQPLPWRSSSSDMPSFLRRNLDHVRAG